MILSPFHRPVLLDQAIDLLNVKPGKNYIDATVGFGGYAKEIIKREGKVLGIDIDEDAIAYLTNHYPNLYIAQGNFTNIKKIAKQYGFDSVDGIIFDLGISSYQLDHAQKGFSYQLVEPLDMRMGKIYKIKASDIINHYSKEKLYEIFTKNAEELNSRTIADAIVRARSLTGEINSTSKLTEIIKKTVNGVTSRKLNRILARIFQALRIEVNQEIKNLEIGLKEAFNLLGKQGRLVVLSYHSLEDRRVKVIFKNYQKRRLINILTKKPITPTQDEIKANSRAQSAKLRAIEKL